MGSFVVGRSLLGTLTFARAVVWIFEFGLGMLSRAGVPKKFQ